MYLSLRDAAREAGVSKTTILRAIRAGRLSAPRNDDGGYAIDPAELFRVYPPGTAMDHEDRNSTGAEDQDAPLQGTTESTPRTAALEAEVQALKELVRRLDLDKQEMFRRFDLDRQDLKAERDRWAGIAEASQRQITHLTEQRRGWWPFRKRA